MYRRSAGWLKIEIALLKVSRHFKQVPLSTPKAVVALALAQIGSTPAFFPSLSQLIFRG